MLSNFGFLLKDVPRLFSRKLELHCQEIGLTFARCRVPGCLQRNGGTTQARLAELTDSDPMTLGRLPSRMEVGALVERRKDPGDGRAPCLYLGPKAAPLLGEIWRLSERTRSATLSGLTGRSGAPSAGWPEMALCCVDGLAGGPRMVRC